MGSVAPHNDKEMDMKMVMNIRYFAESVHHNRADP